MLSPRLFNCYVRNLNLTAYNVGCNSGGMPTNILTYADGMVLLAPSWRALKHLILESCAKDIDIIIMQCQQDVVHGFYTKS